jgi:hypothetical protein
MITPMLPTQQAFVQGRLANLGVLDTSTTAVTISEVARDAHPKAS